MAKYTNLYRLEPYKERVSRLEGYFNGQKNNAKVLEFGKARLREDIKILQRKEDELFKKLNIKNAKELEIRFQEIRKEMAQFSGSYLREAFILPLKSERDEKKATLSLTINKVIDSWLPEVDMSIEDEISIILEKLNAKKKGSFGSFSNRSGKKYSSGIEFVFATKERIKRMEEILKEEGYEDVKIEGRDTWFKITEQKTGESFSEDQKKEKSLEILNLLKQHLSLKSEHLLLFEKCFWHVISESNYDAVFIGKNVKNVTGLLGEISGVYYLCRLFNSSPVAAKNIVKDLSVQSEIDISWIGGLGNPHRDIILAGKGVQVKNTSQDFLKHDIEVDFLSLNLKSFVKRIEELGVGELASSMIENYFRTYEFNVPYVRKGKKFEKGIASGKKAGKQQDFIKTRERLFNISKDVDILLSVFASNFMYMDVEEGITDTNLLFLTANAAIKTASELLEDILNELEGDSSGLPVRIKSSPTDSSFNIVSVLNKDEDALRRKEDVKNSESKLDNVKITTAYKFNIASYIAGL